MVPQALLLTPSRGLGGGIERYVETLEWALASHDIGYQRLDLHQAGPAAHARLMARARAQLRACPEPVRLILAHRALLPVASLLAREPGISGISVVCHGSDVWGAPLRPRRLAENWLLGRPRVRVVAVSSFTAGALVESCPATVLPPGLSQAWFSELVRASAAERAPADGVSVVTAFRLADWQDKGLPELLDAIATLGRTDVHLAVCGSGEPPPALLRLLAAHPCAKLRAGLSDREFAEQLAAADLFVLATRTRQGGQPCGEGFGLVLLEAQVAGTAVVAPAHGGSHDAYLDRVTGLAPTGESAAALASTLAELLGDRPRLARMSGRAAEWARESFAPERYASRVVATLM